MNWRMPLAVSLALLAALSCDQQPVAPESGLPDQLSASFGHAGTAFTGTATIIGCPPPPTQTKVLPNGKTFQTGGSPRYRFEASDPRVTGVSNWSVSKKIEADRSATKIWGKIELVVDGGNGTWDISFHGYRIRTVVVLEAVGQGKEGMVKGLVGKWTLTMGSPGVPLPNPCNRVFATEGYIHKG